MPACPPEFLSKSARKPAKPSSAFLPQRWRRSYVSGCNGRRFSREIDLVQSEVLGLRSRCFGLRCFGLRRRRRRWRCSERGTGVCQAILPRRATHFFRRHLVRMLVRITCVRAEEQRYRTAVVRSVASAGTSPQVWGVWPGHAVSPAGAGCGREETSKSTPFLNFCLLPFAVCLLPWFFASSPTPE